MSSGGFLPVFELKTTAEVENDVAPISYGTVSRRRPF